MYTVLKFYPPTKGINVLSVIGDSLNKIPNDVLSGRDFSGGRFSCAVCDSEDWSEHLEAIAQFLGFFSETIAVARQHQILVEFDVAFEVEDSEEKVYVSGRLVPEILTKLADQNVGITLTYYVPR